MGYGVTYRIVGEICIYQMHALKQDSRPKVGIQYIQQRCVLDIGNVAILRKRWKKGGHWHGYRCCRCRYSPWPWSSYAMPEQSPRKNEIYTSPAALPNTPLTTLVSLHLSQT